MPPRKNGTEKPRAARRNGQNGANDTRLRLEQTLVLNQWMFGLFGVTSLQELTADADWGQYEGFTEDAQTKFLPLIANRKDNSPSLSFELLAGYDRNIVRHWRDITERRLEHGTRPLPKYFQYLALLFTEIYLDRYMGDVDALCEELNQLLLGFNAGVGQSKPLPVYQTDDLRKLALWCATGSGKTLLMHVNVLQYRYYLQKYGCERELSKTILLTPNERLSAQHVEEFSASGMMGELFQKDASSLFQEDRVEVIDVNKLKDEEREKTVDVQAFEGNNLVLVDEGHRGTGGEAWMRYRNQLCSQGFSFEYSATFGQAVQAANNPELMNLYAKCILFDYSYKHFYRDGYGKQYQILNLKDFNSEENRQLYLTACLLAFYQQLRVFQDFRDDMRPFNIEKPLWVFVAARVSQTPTEREVSDVVDSLLFLSGFLKAENRAAVLTRLQSLVSGNAPLLDRHDRPIFKNAFAYLVSLGMTSEQLYADILKLLFNAARPGSFRVGLLKGGEGELALQIGENQPFGLINVGDASDLYKACRQREELQAIEVEVSGSLFSAINRDDSPINLLIGAKKFSEGWNSFRVSTLGLMNVGRSEGSQIIQLFGRGVRLWGRDFCLKRSAKLPGSPPQLALLERLYVFGLRADYMDTFREILEKEGVPPETIELTIPIVKQKWPESLRVLRVQDFDFKKDGPKPALDVWPDKKSPDIALDWYPHVFQIRAADDGGTDVAVKNLPESLTEAHVAFMDMDSVYFELQRHKSESGWTNFNLSKTKLRELLLDKNWYTLRIPPDILEFRSFAQVSEWEQIAVALLKKYCAKFYNYKRVEAEAPHMKYVALKESDDNFIEGDEYVVRLGDADETLRLQIEALATTVDRLREAIGKGDFSGIELAGFGQEFKPLFFSQHIYQPLIATENVEVRPVALNVGERQFVEQLKTFYQKERTGLLSGCELYLLRNRSRGRGIGFFEAGNFHPDFILWLLKGGVQYITFVDPKGIRNEPGLTAPKLRFGKTIKEKQKTLAGKDIILNSFILSRTPANAVRHWEGGITKEQIEAANVLFLSDGGEKYLPKMFAAIFADSVPE